MVAIQDGVHDHDGGELCPGCQFKALLAEHLEWAAGENDLAWHDLTGELIALMGTAISTLTALRVAAVDGHGTSDSTAMAAAAAVSRLGGVIEELHAAIMDDDGEGQGDD